MLEPVTQKTLPLPPFNRREILRYAGVKEEDDRISELLDSCLKECEGVFSGRVCMTRYPVNIVGGTVDLAFAKVGSRALAKNLDDCDHAIVFAATVGIGIDRLVGKYGRVAASRALMFQAIGAERIESLCDTFCREEEATLLPEGFYTRPRFSPGYGDLDISLQKDIFAALGCAKRIGLCLGDNLLMTPTKSVTAIMGYGKHPCKIHGESCEYCDKTDCVFRKG